MGTRNLTMVVSDGKMKVANYGQWDGYPEGQGSVVCDFIQQNLLDSDKLKEFKEKVNKCKYISPKTLKKYWIDVVKPENPDSEFCSMEEAKKFKEKYPQLDRNMGAGVLDYIMRNGGCELENSSNFVNDSLFCEWAYLIDLDKKVLEVYQGFNHRPLKKTDRFYKKSPQKSSSGNEYYPIQLYEKYKFNEATKQAMISLQKRSNKEGE